MSVSLDKLKQAMSQFASGVTVVTTRHGDVPIGITASSFSSLSLDPPLVMVAISKNLFTHGVITDCGFFAINVLSADQVEIGMRFAGMRPEIEDRFKGLRTFTAATNSPILPESLAWVDCEVWATYDGGDHTIFVGEVKDLDVSESDSPLLYHNRLWRRTEALDVPTIPTRAHLIEVGPRDGFQRIETPIPTDRKLAIIRGLAAAGLKHIQATSFVHPKLVPQMADAEQVAAGLPTDDGVTYSALVLNMKGLERAHAAGFRHIETGVPVSETLARKNAGYSVDEGMEEMAQIITRAHELGMQVRGGVQAAFGCAFEGQVEQKQVVQLTRRFLALGVDSLSLSDSAGLGNPQQVRRTVQEVLPLAGEIPVILHLHDTRGQGLANLLSALKSGITHFDTSFGGLGGCPFIPSARGNIPTEDTAHMLEEMGVATGVQVEKLAAVTREMETFLGTELPARMARLA